MQTTFSLSDLDVFSAELGLFLTGFFLLIVGVLSKKNSFQSISNLAILSFIVTACVLSLSLFAGRFSGGILAFGGGLINDPFAVMIKIVMMIGAIIAVMLALKDFKDSPSGRFEYPVLMMFSVTGMMLMVSAHDLLTVYLALELQSLPLYVMASFNRNTLRSPEAGMKYFILGAIASGFYLFGASLVYGYTGSISFNLIGQSLIANQEIAAGFVIGLVFILCAIAFKISAAPFHMWTPDVYEGAPACVTGFFAIVPKLAAIGLLLRLLNGPFAPVWFEAQQIVVALAVLSMLVGVFAALVQDNIRRLLAYSTIANIGFVLVGVAAGGSESVSAALIYMTIYTISTAAMFMVIISLRKGSRSLQNLGDLAGLSSTHPSMAYTMAALLLSVSGIPPLAGFLGKWAVFKAAVENDLIWLAIVGVILSVVAAYYYLRMIKIMFFEVSEVDAPVLELKVGSKIALSLCLAFVLGVILVAGPFFDVMRDVALSLFM